MSEIYLDTFKILNGLDKDVTCNRKLISDRTLRSALILMSPNPVIYYPFNVPELLNATYAMPDLRVLSSNTAIRSTVAPFTLIYVLMIPNKA